MKDTFSKDLASSFFDEEPNRTNDASQFLVSLDVAPVVVLPLQGLNLLKNEIGDFLVKQ